MIRSMLSPATAPVHGQFMALTLSDSLLSSPAPLTECFLTQRHSGYRLAGYELN